MSQEKTNIMNRFRNNSNSIIIQEGKVIFDNVSIKYDLKKTYKALSDISFTINAKEKIGIFGLSEAGKTSIINLFIRYLDPISGKIFIDGKDLTKVDLKSLRKEMDFVTNNDFFKGTLHENLFPPYCQRLSMSEKHDFERILVDKLGLKLRKEGFEFKIENNGDNLTFMEKQLISIGRLFIKKKRLVVMDDVFGDFFGLDSMKPIVKILFEEFKDSTMIMCGTSVKAMMHFDRVLVLKNGNVVEFDTPKNLIAENGGYFRSFYKDMKIKRFELMKERNSKPNEL